MHNTYRHVVVVGIDGAGAFIRPADTPHFDHIFADGAVTYEAYASNPSISAECWGSMLLGVSPKVHGLTNEIVGKTPYPIDSAIPSVFRRIREAMPQARLGSFCDWNPITAGIVEANLDVVNDTARDAELTPKIISYIMEEKPTFLFIQMDSVDGAGHKNGYGTPAHLQRIHEVDILVNDIYEAICKAGMEEDTLFCVIADHGGTNFVNDEGKLWGSHGGWSDEEKLVTFAAHGKNVKQGQIGDMNVRDLAAIILYALGLQLPAFEKEGWTSQIPSQLFDENDIAPYKDISAETGATPRVSKKHHTSELV